MMKKPKKRFKKKQEKYLGKLMITLSFANISSGLKNPYFCSIYGFQEH